MEAFMTDLWPQDLVEKVQERTPMMILQEQASLLGEKTKNIIKAKVEKSEFFGVGGKQNPGDFSFVFIIHAPALGNYSYRVFAMTYDVYMYPVRFLLEQAIAEEIGASSDGVVSAVDEEAFMRVLSEVLGSRRMRRIINALLSQSAVGMEDKVAHSV
jgi:hypothetical protein